MHKHITPERMMTFACLCVLLYFLRPLFIGETILAHDNYYWNFPIFHYTAVTLMSGSLPLWDPFSNGGQPFYPHLIQFRLLEPIVLLTIGVGQLFTQNTVILFNLSKIFQTLVMCLGIYLCLKRYATYRMTRLFLIPSILLSSVFLGGFHQDGILSQFLWVPWVLHYLLAIVFEKDYRWFRFLFLAVFIGLSWQSYHFVGTWTFLFFFAVGIFLFYRPNFHVLWFPPGNRKKWASCSVLILLMMAPNIALISESSRFVFPLRMAPKDFKERLMNSTGLIPSEVVPGDVEIGIKMPYEMIPYTGAMVKVWELLQTLSPDANGNIFALKNPKTWGTPSEAYIYLGLLPWILCLLGWVSPSETHRKLWLTLTTAFGLLMMGPPGGLHRLLFPVFPPLWFIRHTTLFVLFFTFGCLYFLVQGLERFHTQEMSFRLSRLGWLVFSIFLFVLFSFGVFMTKLEYPVFKFPETNYLFVVFGLLAVTSYIVFPWIGQTGLWLALVVAQSCLTLYLSQTANRLFYFLPFLILPWLMLLVSRRWQNGKTLLGSLALMLVCGDLVFSFWSAGRLYVGQVSPEREFGLPMSPKIFNEQSRKVYPTYPYSLFGRQAPRYLSLIHQNPYALSGVLHFKGSERREYPQDIAFALLSPRWNSYLLQKNYFEMIHLQIKPAVLSKIFQIDQSPFQFRSNAFPESAFLSLAKSGGGENILDGAVVIPDQEPLRTAGTNVKSATITTHSYSYNHWEGNVQNEVPGYFLFGDGFDRFWEGSIDGRSVNILRLNLNSKGVYLEKGEHRVAFKYRPIPFLISAFLFLVIPLAVCILLFAAYLKGLYLARHRYALGSLGVRPEAQYPLPVSDPA